MVRHLETNRYRALRHYPSIIGRRLNNECFFLGLCFVFVCIMPFMEIMENCGQGSSLLVFTVPSR